MGNGYNFSGSNMANDAYVLSGWLPQIIKLSNGQLPSNINDLWRLRTQGKVTMGIGTGTLSKQLSSQLHLVSGHDYVIDNIKDGVITVKNPWLDLRIELWKSRILIISSISMSIGNQTINLTNTIFYIKQNPIRTTNHNLQ